MKHLCILHLYSNTLYGFFLIDAEVDPELRRTALAIAMEALREAAPPAPTPADSTQVSLELARACVC